MKNIKDLQPKALWTYFDEILQIPRPSGKEEKIINFLMEFAKKHELEVKKDQTGNVLISKAAYDNYKNRKMVCSSRH